MKKFYLTATILYAVLLFFSCSKSSVTPKKGSEPLIEYAFTSNVPGDYEISFTNQEGKNQTITVYSGLAYSTKFSLEEVGMVGLNFTVKDTNGAVSNDTMSISINGSIVKSANFSMSSTNNSYTINTNYNNQ